jgi:bifunctional polynucleotide phosphatase/kinase
MHLMRTRGGIVVLSNQQNLLDNPKRKAIFEGRACTLIRKLTDLCKEESIPCSILVAASVRDDFYRKPRPGLVFWYAQKFGLDTDLLVREGLYVGDAAGRDGDHASSDLYFAVNSGMKFCIPESIFNTQVLESLSVGEELAPDVYDVGKPLLEVDDSWDYDVDFDEYDVVVCVGPPGSGKSTFVKKTLVNHVWINQDTLRTSAKCLGRAHEALEKSSRVVIDNTNPNRESRAKWVDLPGKKLCLWFDTPRPVSEHNNAFRKYAKDGMNALKSARPDVKAEIVLHSGHVAWFAIDKYFKLFEEPLEDEGFDRVVRVPFVPKFANEHEKWLWELVMH